MVNVLCIGDLHYSERNSREIDSFEKECLDVIRDIDPTFVIIMGDTLDGHKRINSEMQNKAIRFFRKIAKSHKLFVLIGNHDMINNKQYLTEDHAFYCLKEEERIRSHVSNYTANISEEDAKIKSLLKINSNNNIYIVDRVRIFDVDDVMLCFVPYVPAGQFREALKSNSRYTEDSKVVIFAHQEIRGCNMGHNIESSKGDVWTENDPILISGHIHKHQIINNVVYVGTPYQTNISESTDKALLHIAIEENLEGAESITNKDITLNYKRIPLDNIILRETIEIDIKDIDDLELENRKQYRVIVRYRDNTEINHKKDKIRKIIAEKGEIYKINFLPIIVKQEFTGKKGNFFELLSNSLSSDMKVLYNELQQ